jgi:hypothetical protein
MIRPHPWHACGARPRGRSEQVQGDDLEAVAPIIVGEALELPRRRTAGVVDQDVDAAEALHGGGNHPLDAVRGRQVGADRQHLGTGRGSDLLGRRRKLLLAPRTDRDPSALTGQGERRRLAQALAGRGNDRDLAAKTKLHTPPPSSDDTAKATLPKQPSAAGPARPLGYEPGAAGDRRVSPRPCGGLPGGPAARPPVPCRARRTAAQAARSAGASPTPTWSPWRSGSRAGTMVRGGRVGAGLGLLDEAMVAVVAGELSPRSPARCTAR